MVPTPRASPDRAAGARRHGLREVARDAWRALRAALAGAAVSSVAAAQPITLGGGVEVGGAVLQQPTIRASGAGYVGLTAAARSLGSDLSLTAFGAAGVSGWTSTQLAASVASPQWYGTRLVASGARFSATGISVFSHGDLSLATQRDVRDLTLGARMGAGQLRYRGAAGGDWFAAASLTRWRWPLALSLDATVSGGQRPVDLIEPLRSLPPIQLQPAPPIAGDSFQNISLAPPRQYRYGVADVAMRAAWKRGAWRSEVELMTRPWLDNVAGQRVAASLSLAWTPAPQATIVLTGGERLPNVREGIPAGRWLTLGIRMEPRSWTPIRARTRGSAPAGPALLVERQRIIVRGIDSSTINDVTIRGDFTDWTVRSCTPLAGQRGTVTCGAAPGAGAWRVAVRVGLAAQWRPPVNLAPSADDFGAEDGLLLIGR